MKYFSGTHGYQKNALLPASNSVKPYPYHPLLDKIPINIKIYQTLHKFYFFISSVGKHFALYK